MIFDLDGTLADSAQDLGATLNAILAEHDLPPAPLSAVRDEVGHGARALLARGFALGGATLPEGEAEEKILERFLSHYADHIADKTVLFPGVEPCLDALTAQGAALAVCTNKRVGLAVPLLEALGVVHRFEPIFGRDSLPEYKPSGLPLTTILERTGRRRGIMVGDTITDIEAARAAAMPCAFATFGYGAGKESGADLSHVTAFASFTELTALISRLSAT